jgi:hypothetical protein
LEKSASAGFFTTSSGIASSVSAIRIYNLLDGSG